MGAAPDPFELRDGRLVLDDVALDDIVAAQEGRPAWIVSLAAVEAAMAAAGGGAGGAASGATAGDAGGEAVAAGGADAAAPVLAIGAVGSATVLRLAASAGWRAAAHSSHELEAAASAGFPPERIVLAGAVKDDGLIKDGVFAGVGAVQADDEDERRAVQRIADLLERPAPAMIGAPELSSPSSWPTSGGLLTAVLRGPPDLVLDAPWELDAPGGGQDVWPLSPGPASSATVRGLARSGGAGARPARLHGAASRGDWVLLPHVAALALHPRDPVHVEPERILVRNGSWRTEDQRA